MGIHRMPIARLENPVRIAGSPEMMPLKTVWISLRKRIMPSRPPVEHPEKYEKAAEFAIVLRDESFRLRQRPQTIREDKRSPDMPAGSRLETEIKSCMAALSDPNPYLQRRIRLHEQGRVSGSIQSKEAQVQCRCFHLRLALARSPFHLSGMANAKAVDSELFAVNSGASVNHTFNSRAQYAGRVRYESGSRG